MDEEPLFVEDAPREELVDLTSETGGNFSGKNNEEEELFVNSPIQVSYQSDGGEGGVNDRESDMDRSKSGVIDRGQGAESGVASNSYVADHHPEGPTELGAVVDRVKLASLLKTFNAGNDAFFRDVPDYMAEIIKEMLENDFLLVLGRGLGLATIMKLFLAKVKQIAANALVLVLGHRSEDEIYGDGHGDMTDTTSSTDRDGRPDNPSEEPQTIGFGISSTKRAKFYSSGGVYHITGPIAVVDMLTGVLDCSRVSGLVIAHGELIGEHSTIAFAIRLLKERNPMAFIKALSDAPERLVMPPSLPLKLRVLGVPTIMLWPRFHLSVDRSLPKLVVDEVVVEQSVAVRQQQALLSEMMQAVISDVKRRVPHLDVDFLGPELGPQQSNPDKLNASMSVDTLLSSSDFPWRVRNALRGVWHQLSKDGRNSVHSLGTLQQLQNTLTVFDARTFYAQLEFARRDTSQPWTDLPVVSALLAEARRSAALRRMPGKFYHIRSLLKGFAPHTSVIIMCDSLKTVYDLHHYLGRREEDNAEDEQALRELEEEMRQRDEEEQRVKAAQAAATVNNGRPGRRRVRGGGNISVNSRVKQEVDDIGESESRQASEEASANNNSTGVNTASNNVSNETGKRVFDEIDLTADEPEIDIIDEITSPFETLQVTFTTYRGKEPLSGIKPSHIIMYDPNLAFTREVERYVASQIKTTGSSNVEVHFMYYQQSAEELRYLSAMRREKDAFTRLIREKGLMPMHLQDGDPAGGADTSASSLMLSSSRRHYQVNSVRPRVVVDVREFRSPLPFHIWQTRMDVIPLTLLVGDYILTPEIVVERKSVSDLIGSFRDGRLYQQCEAMLKYYNIACLLLEFDNKSHFTMEPFKDIRTRSADVQREIQENLCTLMLRFPKLRLLWSSSPVHSAQIFQAMKDLEAEPEPEQCAKAGQSMLMDSVALSMLESMPGLTPRTAPLIARKVANFVELVNLSQEEMRQILGTDNGDRLWRFVNNDKGSS